MRLADLVLRLRHDVARIAYEGDPDHAVRGVEILDSEVVDAPRPGQFLLAVGLDATSGPQVEAALRIAAGSGGVLVVKSQGDRLEGGRPAGVPVVLVDPLVPWSWIQRLTSAVIAGYVGEELSDQRARGDLFSLVNSVAAAVHGAVMIMDADHSLVAYSNLPGQPIDETRRRSILGRRVPEEALTNFLAREVWRSETVVRQAREGDLPRLGVVIRAGDEVLGSLWVALASSPEAPDTETTLMGAANVAAVHLLALRQQVDADQNGRNAAFRGVLDKPSRGAAGLRLPAVLLGADVPDPTERHTAKLLQVLDLLGSGCRAHGHQPALALGGDRVYALLPIALAGAVPVPTLVGHLRDRVARALRLTLTVVSSGDLRSPAAVQRARLDVDSALDHLRAEGGDLGYATTDQLRAELVRQRLLDLISGDPLLRTGVGERIATYDQRHDTQFSPTLLAFLRHFGDIATASTELLIHQNTTRQRLRRSRELFELDLDNAAQRLLLELELTAAARSAGG